MFNHVHHSSLPGAYSMRCHCKFDRRLMNGAGVSHSAVSPKSSNSDWRRRHSLSIRLATRLRSIHRREPRPRPAGSRCGRRSRPRTQHPNDQSGPDRIEFNIPGTDVQMIVPFSAFPAITDPIVIDGYTQPGAKAQHARRRRQRRPEDQRLRQVRLRHWTDDQRGQQYRARSRLHEFRDARPYPDRQGRRRHRGELLRTPRFGRRLDRQRGRPLCRPRC